MYLRDGVSVRIGLLFVMLDVFLNVLRRACRCLSDWCVFKKKFGSSFDSHCLLTFVLWCYFNSFSESFSHILFCNVMCVSLKLVIWNHHIDYKYLPAASLFKIHTLWYVCYTAARLAVSIGVICYSRFYSCQVKSNLFV